MSAPTVIAHGSLGEPSLASYGHPATTLLIVLYPEHWPKDSGHAFGQAMAAESLAGTVLALAFPPLLREPVSPAVLDRLQDLLRSIAAAHRPPLRRLIVTHCEDDGIAAAVATVVAHLLQAEMMVNTGASFTAHEALVRTLLAALDGALPATALPPERMPS